ncbi:MAG: rhomboid family protein [Stygiobacter sp.]|nr:MAG: rhomboid family protein [Stygiobacter sp.]KAF0217668.1 MAG: rhomboid family [Ignavibacteria bacterium]
MNCPSCNGQLKNVTLGGIEVSGCGPCDGVWIRKNDVNPFLTYMKEYRNKGKKIRTSENSENELLNGQKGRYCPDCNSSTEVFEWGESDVISFSCPKNCGAWLRLKQLGNILDWYETIYNPNLGYRFFKINEKTDGVVSGETSFLKGFLGWVNDDINVTSTPIITITLIIINVIFFIGTFFIDPYQVLNLCFFPSKFLNDPGVYAISLFTSMFMHGGVGHLLGNMLFLYLFGKGVEDKMGIFLFIAIYLSTGVIATFAHMLLTTDPSAPVLGASGAISGIMGGYLFLFPKATISFHTNFLFIPFKINLKAWFYLGIWFFLQQVLGILSSTNGIAWYAHLGGFTAGFAILFLLVRVFKQ